jgi:chaperone required for assembly of F1-ATPase
LIVGGGSNKRFYQKAEVVETGAGTFSVALDGRKVHTPARNELRVPARALADAVRDEWESQTDQVNPAGMPMMRFTATALDRVGSNRDEVVSEIAGYGASDLLCYRAASPADLVARQQATWQPLLEWAGAEFGAHLKATEGVMPVAQKDAALAALRAAAAHCDDLVLSGLHGVTVATGSVVIGLAVVHGRLDGAAAWHAAQIDETYQTEKWGEDAEAAVRRDNLRATVDDAARFLRLCA